VLRGSATSSQAIRGHISVMSTLKFTYFLVKEIMLVKNNCGTSFIGDILISFARYNI
jgi:hypothetical protein